MILDDISLLPHNTFGMDVKARHFFEFSSREELREALPSLPRPLLCIGKGSNLLFCSDFPGTVVHSAIKSLEVEEFRDFVLVKAGSGIVWDEFVEWCVEHGYYGAENLSGIPGEVGASAVQNIGAYGAEVCQIIERVEAVDAETGEVWLLDGSECGYAYRDSIFKHSHSCSAERGCAFENCPAPQNTKYIITSVTYRLSRKWEPNLTYKALAQDLDERCDGVPSAALVRQAVKEMRDGKLPDSEVLGNAGSFFVNPIVEASLATSLAKDYPRMPQFAAEGGRVKLSAAWLIDQCGWKGRSLGPAGCYERQPLVLVNLGGAEGKDIIALAEAVIRDVKARFGVTLSMEVNRIG